MFLFLLNISPKFKRKMAVPPTAGPFLVQNGTSIDAAPVSSFLASTSGAYTTTRTFSLASLLFLDRHLRRLADSARLLSIRSENLRPLVCDSLRAGFRIARGRGGDGEEMTVTALVRGREGVGEVDVFVHLGFYVPPVFGVAGAWLAVAGPGRDLPQAKCSDWVRIRKNLERMRPPSVTELLLSNDGDGILEGTVTNFFVVRRNDGNVINADRDIDSANATAKCPYIVQTASISDGVLPGVIRELVFDICSCRGIPLREIPPSWSERELWEEAFITSSLRLVQHVEVIQAPSSHAEFGMKSWREVSWIVKRFEGVGDVTSLIQKDLKERAAAEGFQISNL